MTQKLPLNLTLREFITTVSTQPKPLIIPLCTELPLPDISPLDVYTGTRKYLILLESMEGSEKVCPLFFHRSISAVFIISLGKTVDLRGREFRGFSGTRTSS